MFHACATEKSGVQVNIQTPRSYNWDQKWFFEELIRHLRDDEHLRNIFICHFISLIVAMKKGVVKQDVMFFS